MKPTIIFKLLPVVLLVSCSNVDNYSYWEQESEEPYSKEYFPDITSITVHTHIYENWGGPASPYNYNIDVHEGMDLRKYFCWSSSNSEYNLIGLYTDPEYKHYLKASQIVSYDMSFKHIYCKWELMGDTEDYIFRYHGSYQNCLGDELTFTHDCISFDYSVSNEIKLRIELSDIDDGDRYVPPTAHSIKINGKKIDGGFNIYVTNSYSFYSEEIDDYDTKFSVLKNSLELGNGGLLNYMNKYFELVGDDYRIDRKEDLNVFIRAHYSSDNRVTIRYDI